MTGLLLRVAVAAALAACEGRVEKEAAPNHRNETVNASVKLRRNFFVTTLSAFVAVAVGRLIVSRDLISLRKRDFCGCFPGCCCCCCDEAAENRGEPMPLDLDVCTTSGGSSCNWPWLLLLWAGWTLLDRAIDVDCIENAAVPRTFPSTKSASGADSLFIMVLILSYLP
jgi:hypothetical protein